MINELESLLGHKILYNTDTEYYGTKIGDKIKWFKSKKQLKEFIYKYVKDYC